MGQPVRILDIARQLVARSNRHVEIVFTGLRSGEKLHEVLFSADERGVVKAHPLISHVPVPPIDPANPMVGHPGLATSPRPMRLVVQ
jgi:FlaA1/EpsC-like NDP-sugar epimerase